MNKKTLYLVLVILLIILLISVLGGLFFYYKSLGVKLQNNTMESSAQNHKPTQAEINKALSEVRSDTPITNEVQKQITTAFEGVKSTSTTKTTQQNNYNQGGAEMSAEQRAAIEAALKGTH